MTLRKRLSMTGAIVADESSSSCCEKLEEAETFVGQSTNTREVGGSPSMEASVSPLTLLEADKKPCEVEAPPPILPLPESPARRRRSWFGSRTRADASVERSSDDVDNNPNKKPASSHQRRSFLGSSAPDLDSEAPPGTPKQRTPRRRSFFGSDATKSSSDKNNKAEIDMEASQRSESTISSRLSPSSRAQSLLGSSAPTLDETIIGRKPPRPTSKVQEQLESSESSSLNSSLRSERSAEIPPRPGAGRSRHRGVDRTKSLDATASAAVKRKEKNHILKRGNGLGASWSFHSVDGKLKDRPPEKVAQESAEKEGKVPASPGTPKASKSFVGRRLSLGSLVGKGRDSDAADDEEQAPKSPNATVRRGSFTAMFRSPSPQRNKKSISDKRSRRRSTGGGGGGDDCPVPSSSSSSKPLPPAPPATANANPYDLVNKSRAKRGLPEFSRNMLMDTLAKQVALDLAASNGSYCTPTSYHGNIGQGESIEKIHKKIMKEKGETARANLLSMHFTTIGIGIAKDKDGLIFLCELFQ